MSASSAPPPSPAPAIPPAAGAPCANAVGTVSLVGAGPGDPELLTLKAARVLQGASLVLYDHLVSPDVLDLLPAGAERRYVGKQSGQHSLPQDEIIALMVELARAGRSLVRLKGGDPYVFGRGGEEAAGLAAAGVPFQVIPGISAAQAAAASAGIPLTHRDHAHALVLATGHLRGEGAAKRVELDWDLLVRPNQTVAIYMGLGALAQISAELLAHGLPPDTPAAVVERASTPQQRTIAGSVASLPALAAQHAVASPALILIGGVVSLHALLGPAGPAPGF